MSYMMIGIVLLGGFHLFSMLLPARRDALKLRFGEKAWKGSFALVSLVGLGFMICGFFASRAGPGAADLLYYPADWTRHLTMLLVLLAFISLGASHGKGYLKLWLRNPMSIGFALWSFGHLLANGKRASVYMFGTFLVIALLDIILSTLRGKRPVHEPRIRSDVIAVIVGLVLYLIFLFGFHPYVLNLPVVE